MHDRVFHTAVAATRPPRAMRFVMAVVAVWTVAAIVLAWALVDTGPFKAPRSRHHPALSRPAPVVPPTVVPPVEPIEYAAIPPEEAREVNALVPFSTAPNPAARPFLLKEPALDRQRATDCLAAAMLYEAGSGDPEGQLAVAQVIINRMRHPAFPKTICGVVFQGQERRTGCQFTFTCDGALRRTPGAEAWQGARERAGRMLDGEVYRQVGHATHYHTDWVVPYWSSSLDKVTAVRTHLFFRWTGWWGTPGAFRGTHGGPEPIVRKIGFLSPVHALGADGTVLPVDAAVIAGLELQPVLQDGAGTFVLLIDKAYPANDFPAFAASVCVDRPFCKVLAWGDRAQLPAGLPIDAAATSTMSFSYLRDRARGFEKALWNCTRHPRPEVQQCMKQRIVLQSPRAAPTAGGAQAGPQPAQPAPTTPVRPPAVSRTVADGPER